MPEMDGLETLVAIRKQYPRLPVISTLTARAAITTLDALSRGSSDYVTKPSNVGGVAAAQQSLSEQLIKALCGKAELIPHPSTTPVRIPARAVPKTSMIDVVAIGVSTGGPNALCEVLPAIPNDFPVPIVIVQHMPPMFTRLLADRLNQQCQIGVREATLDEPLLAGQAYVAPGDYHMVLKRQMAQIVLSLHRDPPENSRRPAVEVLFRSAVDVYQSGTLGVILTGMGQDGLRGCELIRDVGGQVLAQDEASSIVWGMPGFVVKSGLANQVLSLNRIAPEIVRRVCQGRAVVDSKRGAACS